MSKRTVWWTAGAVAVIGIVLAWGSFSGQNRGKDELLMQYTDEQADIMEDLREDMKAVESGNASVDFLAGMIPHHESAVDLSESYLKYGAKKPELKQLAKEIIDLQSSEIEQMRRMMQEIEEAGEVDETKEKAYLEEYNAVMEKHQNKEHETAKAKNVEQAFAENMITHHQMAVDMASAIVDTTDEPDVRRLAENIIDTQEKEIAQMEEILDAD